MWDRLPKGPARVRGCEGPAFGPTRPTGATTNSLSLRLILSLPPSPSARTPASATPCSTATPTRTTIKEYGEGAIKRGGIHGEEAGAERGEKERRHAPRPGTQAASSAACAVAVFRFSFLLISHSFFLFFCLLFVCHAYRRGKQGAQIFDHAFDLRSSSAHSSISVASLPRCSLGEV